MAINREAAMVKQGDAGKTSLASATLEPVAMLGSKGLSSSYKQHSAIEMSHTGAADGPIN